MKLGRNDPCHCGSGKKYKQCCLQKDEEAALAQRLAEQEQRKQKEVEASKPAPPQWPEPPKPPGPKPVDPHIEALNARWDEFKAQDHEGQIALFLKTVEEPKLMDDEMAFEMLNTLYPQLCKHNERERYEALVEQLRERLPKVYSKSAHYYLENRITNAVIAGRIESLPVLVNELAQRAGKDIDTFDNVVAQLAYHGQLGTLVDAMHIAWPLVKKSRDVLPWGVDEFAEQAMNFVVFDYLEHHANPVASDPELVERLEFYNTIRPEPFAAYLAGIAGQAKREWTAKDFAIAAHKRQARDDDDDDQDDSDDERKKKSLPKKVRQNLFDLSHEFHGYLRREENVPFTKGDLARASIVRYLQKRYAGELEPKPSLFEKMMNPQQHKTKPRPVINKMNTGKPGQSVHWLCPDRSTFERHLIDLLHFLNPQHYQVAATFELMPSWLRFLESRRLIEAAQRINTLRDLRGLHADLLKLYENHLEDPTLLAAVKKACEKVEAELTT